MKLPSPVVNDKLEKKVSAGAAGAGFGTVLATILGPVVEKLPLPRFIKPIILFLLPAISSLAAGWLAPHTPRVGK